RRGGPASPAPPPDGHRGAATGRGAGVLQPRVRRAGSGTGEGRRAAVRGTPLGVRPRTTGRAGDHRAPGPRPPPPRPGPPRTPAPAVDDDRRDPPGGRPVGHAPRGGGHPDPPRPRR